MADIDSVAKTDVSTTIVFACANPNGVAVGRIDRDTTDGVGIVIFKDWRESRSSICRFKDVSGCDGNVPSVWICLLYTSDAADE